MRMRIRTTASCVTTCARIMERGYKLTMKADPNNASEHENFGILLSDMRKDDEPAEREYKLAVDQNYASAHNNCAMACAKI